MAQGQCLKLKENCRELTKKGEKITTRLTYETFDVEYLITFHQYKKCFSRLLS